MQLQRKKSNSMEPWNIKTDIFKRGFDVFTSILGLMILSPVLLPIAILIKTNSKGPVFYRGLRVGRAENNFKIFKFRTMVIDADKIGGPSTSDDDPRITKIGKLLRQYKLDEIPQLLNIVKGEMSFVGPRPEVPSEVVTYTEEQKKILTIKPGITDWASLAFHNEGEILKGSTDPHASYREKIRPEKLRLALKYVNERSFLTDMKIIFNTLATLIRTRAEKVQQ